jgi:hypothetical protein
MTVQLSKLSTLEIRMHEWYMVASNKYKLEDFTFVMPEDAFLSKDNIDPVRHLFFDDLWSLYHRQTMETNYLTLLSAFRPPGVPGPTSKLSLRVPAQMGRRETEHKGEQ